MFLKHESYIKLLPKKALDYTRQIRIYCSKAAICWLKIVKPKE